MTIDTECGSKRTYRSKAEAKRSEARMRSFKGGSRQHPYRCSYCGLIHLGHGHVGFDSPRAILPDGDELVGEQKKTKARLRTERWRLRTATRPAEIAAHENRIARLEQHLHIIKGEVS